MLAHVKVCLRTQLCERIMANLQIHCSLKTAAFSHLMTMRESWDFIAGLEFYRALGHLEFPVPKQD